MQNVVVPDKDGARSIGCTVLLIQSFFKLGMHSLISPCAVIVIEKLEICNAVKVDHRDLVSLLSFILRSRSFSLMDTFVHLAFIASFRCRQTLSLSNRGMVKTGRLSNNRGTVII